MIGIALVLSAHIAVLDAGGQSKVDSVKALLSSFGVPGPYRLQMLNVPEDTRFSGTTVVLTDRDHIEYKANFPSANYKTFILRRTQGEFFIGYPTRDLHDRTIEARARAGAARYFGKEQVKFDGLVVGDKRMAEATFSITRNGYSFVDSSQHYGYSVTMTVPDAKFVSFTAKEDPPQVDPTPAKISAIQAVNAFKQEFDSVIAPHWLTNHHMKMTYSKLGTPVLGYFLPPGQTVARLVWSVPYRLYRRWDDGATMGFGATFIDAVTGKWIPREGEL